MGLISLAATTPHALAEIARETDLVAFQTEVSEQEALEAGVIGTHTLRFSRVAIDPELLRLPGTEDSPPGTWLNTGGSHAIEPFGGERYTVRGRRVEASDDGTWSWVGQVEGYEHGDFVLSVNGEQVYGTLRAGPLTLEFQTGDDGWHYVREPDVDAYGGCTHIGEGHKHEIGASLNPARSSISPLPAGVSLSRTVDVLLLYSPAVAGRYDITTLANNAAASMNTAFADSGVDAAVRIVHYHEVTGYSEPQPMDPDVDVLGLGFNIRNGVTPFGFVNQMRADHDADLVHMLFDASKSPDVCGWGFLLGDESGDSDLFTAVSGDECISAQNVFAHEIGHNLGGAHDPWEKLGTIPFNYSNGYSRSSPTRRTIMGSTNCVMDDCVRLNRWSSPNLYANGDPMGNAIDADMVHALDDIVPVVADYLVPNASTPGTPQGVDVESGQCYDLNWLSWTAASGVVGWYEVQTSLQSNFAVTSDIYRGPIQSLLAISASQTTYVRIRACNSAACSSWASSASPATYTNGCL